MVRYIGVFFLALMWLLLILLPLYGFNGAADSDTAFWLIYFALTCITLFKTIKREDIKTLFSKKHRQKTKRLRQYIYDKIRAKEVPSVDNILEIEKEDAIPKKSSEHIKRNALEEAISVIINDDVVNNEEFSYIEKLATALSVASKNFSKIDSLNYLYNLQTKEKRVSTSNYDFNLQRGERAVYSIKAVSYKMSRRSSALFYAGVTKKVDLGLGFKLRLGAFKGARPTSKHLDKTSKGRLVITSKRVVYVSNDGGNIVVKNDKIGSIAISEEKLYIHVFNRKSPYVFEPKENDVELLHDVVSIYCRGKRARKLKEKESSSNINEDDFIWKSILPVVSMSLFIVVFFIGREGLGNPPLDQSKEGNLKLYNETISEIKNNCLKSKVIKRGILTVTRTKNGAKFEMLNKGTSVPQEVEKCINDVFDKKFITKDSKNRTAEFKISSKPKAIKTKKKSK